MAWDMLPTNYTDAVWSGLKKYSQINNPDGTVSFQDVTIYSGKETSFFGAKDANRMNEALNTIMSIVENSSNDGRLSNAGTHNAIFRGENLGSSVSAKHYKAIADGSFEDLYIGDYWQINGINYRIAAFDYYFNTGDTACTKHHAVIVPDTQLYTAQMHKTPSGSYESGAANTTKGGYVGTDLYKTGLDNAKTTIKSAFAGHVLSHRLYLTNAVANGRASAGAWFDSEVDLMTEHMVYGNGVFSPVSDGNSVPTNYRIDKSQLPLFMFRPDLISNRQWYWLRDVVSAAYFAGVTSNGYADYRLATNVHGVRPVFLIS